MKRPKIRLTEKEKHKIFPFETNGQYCANGWQRVMRKVDTISNTTHTHVSNENKTIKLM